MNGEAVRVQLSRRKGFRLPSGAVVVGRPSKWGNPYVPRPGQDPAGVVARYRNALIRGDLGVTIGDVRAELRGKPLACWCRIGAPCHADVLLEVANGGTP
jgi:Domain of unknown function (DUF4326)